MDRKEFLAQASRILIDLHLDDSAGAASSIVDDDLPF
jgi:hypothetical protein